MSKHINTHLFFHMNDSGGSKQKDSSSSSTTRKPKKTSSNLFSGYEIDNNPPLPSETGDYYDYYTNYGIPDYYGPTSPTSPPYAYAEDPYQYYEYRNNEYDYYNHSNAADYGDNYGGERNYGTEHSYRENFPASHSTNHNTGQIIPANQPSTSGYSHHPRYLQPPLVSPPIQDPKRASPTMPFASDLWATSYRNDISGEVAHKLHRITFVEACIFQPPDLPSPVRHAGPPPPPPGHHVPSQVPPPVRPPLPVLAQGERSPTSTGGTQYYQEWTSKHMRHLCNRFEKPAQQQLLMNVERKSKYPFIILCTPVTHSSSLSKSSSNSSSNKPRPYHREISHHSAYSLEEEEEDEEHWITQKQRDSINSHYLPPPPPPLLMPHIWPEIRYIDGLYTVCATIVRPGSGVPSELDALSELGFSDQPGYGAEMHDNPYNHHHSQQRHEKHITFQDSQPSGSGSEENPRPAGYIVSAFATFPGEDSERLEKNWLLWTGARILYKYLPMCVGLRRLIFLKRCPDMYRDDLSQQSKVKPTIFTGFTYVLLCECFNLQDAYIASVCTTIDQLRARCCGYSALYLTHYQQQAGGGGQPVRPLPTQIESSSGMSRHPVSTSTSTSSHHHHHHVPPRHHRSTQDFTEFDNER